MQQVGGDPSLGRTAKEMRVEPAGDDAVDHGRGESSMSKRQRVDDIRKDNRNATRGAGVA